MAPKEPNLEFEYSREFKKQDELRHPIDFPAVDKVYESKERWHYSVMRIPRPEHAEVEEILKREHSREDDALSLLKRFGERTIANPFRLRRLDFFRRCAKALK